MALFPFILLRSSEEKKNILLINHEKIHLKQQIELLILPFYLWYAIEFCIHFLRLKDYDKAYYSISFEREAYANEHDLHYLRKRKFWNFRKYLSL